MNTFRKISILVLLIGLMPIAGTQIASAAGAPQYGYSIMSETVSVNQPITGYTIINTGGETVTSYRFEISYSTYRVGGSPPNAEEVPAGLSFNSATGAFSGTPTIAYGLIRISIYALSVSFPTGDRGAMTTPLNFNLTVVGPPTTPTPPTAEQIAAAAVAAAEAARVAAEEAAAAAAVEAARVRALAVVQAKTALNNVLAGSTAPSIEQYRAADYTIRTQASFDRITAAVAKLSVSDRQDPTKLAALIKEIELDESFFNVSVRPSINIYSDYGVLGVTARTLPTVNAQVLQLPIGERGDVAAIQKIAVVENFVDQIANPQTRGNMPTSTFVARGLVAVDNPYKDALVIAAQGLLAKFDEASINTLEEITAVVARVNAIALKLPVADRTDPSKIAAAIVEEAKTELSSVLGGSTPPTIEQLRSANYAVTTKASFDRITAALAKLPVVDRQDPAKLAALIKAIELDESFFNSSARPTLTTYTDYGVAGVTVRTLPAVNAQVLLLPAVQRTDVVAIQKIAEVENFVDQVANPATRGSTTASTFVSRGLLTADNPYKESVIAGLKSFDEYSLNTLAKVTSVIKVVNDAVLALPMDERSNSSSIASMSAKLAAVQTFVDRVSNVQTRPSIRSSDFIVRKLMPADTPYKYSVLVNLQSYAEDSLNSMEKIAAAIKTEINKALQRRELTSKIKASIAAKRR
jgi:hypothetical protein